VDRIHEQNRYFVAMRQDVVIGMISAHGGPEFSVKRRLPNAALLESLPRPIEVRLLAIDPKERNRTVLAGLLWQAYDYAVSGGYSHLLISAISTREAMYQKMGFHALGPAVPERQCSLCTYVDDTRRAAARGGRTRWAARAALASGSRATHASELAARAGCNPSAHCGGVCKCSGVAPLARLR
jgi:hypothetical protein